MEHDWKVLCFLEYCLSKPEPPYHRLVAFIVGECKGVLANAEGIFNKFKQQLQQQLAFNSIRQVVKQEDWKMASEVLFTLAPTKDETFWKLWREMRLMALLQPLSDALKKGGNTIDIQPFIDNLGELLPEEERELPSERPLTQHSGGLDLLDGDASSDEALTEEKRTVIRLNKSLYERMRKAVADLQRLQGTERRKYVQQTLAARPTDSLLEELFEYLEPIQREWPAPLLELLERDIMAGTYVPKAPGFGVHPATQPGAETDFTATELRAAFPGNEDEWLSVFQITHPSVRDHCRTHGLALGMHKQPHQQSKPPEAKPAAPPTVDARVVAANLRETSSRLRKLGVDPLPEVLEIAQTTQPKAKPPPPTESMTGASTRTSSSQSQQQPPGTAPQKSPTAATATRTAEPTNAKKRSLSPQRPDKREPKRRAVEQKPVEPPPEPSDSEEEREPSISLPAVREEEVQPLPTPQQAASAPVSYRPPRSEQRKRKPFSSTEVRDLIRGVERHGEGRWKQILVDPELYFNDRTSVDLKDKWRNLKKIGQVPKKYLDQPEENTSS